MLRKQTRESRRLISRALSAVDRRFDKWYARAAKGVCLAIGHAENPFEPRCDRCHRWVAHYPEPAEVLDFIEWLDTGDTPVVRVPISRDLVVVSSDGWIPGAAYA